MAVWATVLVQTCPKKLSERDNVTSLKTLAVTHAVCLGEEEEEEEGQGQASPISRLGAEDLEG